MRKPSRTGWYIAATLAAGALIASAQIGFGFEALRSVLAEGLPSLARFNRPDFTESPRLGHLVLETVAMGLFGTLLTLAMALPLTAVASRNLAMNSVTYRISREFLNFLRAMPDIVLALILVQGFGVGPFAGAVALGLHSAGFLGKVLSESIERLSPGVLAGLESCGATRFQCIRFGAWPSIQREIAGYTLYILDRNIRVATTLGLVGAGGLGAELLGSLRTFQYAKAAASLCVIVALILAVELFSNQVRKHLS